MRSLGFIAGALWLSLPVAGAEPILPPRLGDSTRVQWLQVAAPELERTAGESAVLLREYGGQGSEQARYERPGHSWQVTVYRMQDRSAAYGAFTLLGARGDPIGVGEGGVRTAQGLVFYQGPYFVTADRLAGVADLKPLLERLETLAGLPASLPPLRHYLPQEGLIQGSTRYLLGPIALSSVAPAAPGDWAGFAYGAEGVSARYRVGGRETTLLLLSYPTPQIAQERMRSLEELFGLAGPPARARQPVQLRRTSSLLAVAIGDGSPGVAERLFDRIAYEARISWSQPGEGRPDFNWPKTLLNLFIGTGLLVLVTLLLGVTFGALRLGVKRLLPGRVFDRPQDTEIISLDLGRKA